MNQESCCTRTLFINIENCVIVVFTRMDKFYVNVFIVLQS